MNSFINLANHPIDQTAFREACKLALDEDGVLVLPGFLTPETVAGVAREGVECQQLAYYTVSDHNAYLKTPDPAYTEDHPRNRLVSSSKGCITTDQIPPSSPLHKLYDCKSFKAFLCAVLDEDSLHEYADPLSSINLHYAAQGQELGWHFDNSSFAITLLIQKPEAGAAFEYVRDVRNADSGDMNYERCGKVLDGDVPVKTLSMDTGTLVLFRGRNSLHRVTPTQGNITRMLVVLAYNTKPNIALSESARMTFYGRLE
ncbi:MAG: hypothetical protein AB8B87_24950 [Granulosicoccus sp.]